MAILLPRSKEKFWLTGKQKIRYGNSITNGLELFDVFDSNKELVQNLSIANTGVVAEGNDPQQGPYRSYGTSIYSGYGHTPATMAAGTVFAIFRPLTSPTGFLNTTRTGSASGGFEFLYNGTEISLRVGGSAGNKDLTYLSLPSNEWSLIIGRWDSSSVKCDLYGGDGSYSSASATTAGTVSSAQQYLLNNRAGYQEYTGDIAAHGYYSRALSDSEVTALSQAFYKEMLKPKKSYFFVPDGGDNLLAEDVESASSVSSPVIGQSHSLAGTSLEALSEVSTPLLGQSHALLSVSVESASAVSTPIVGQSHNLSSVSVESASQVSTPVIGISGTDSLLSISVESASQISSPVISQAHALTANDVQSASSVSVPVFSANSALLSNDIAALSQVSTPSISQSHVLLPVYVESASETSTPLLGQIHAFIADNIEAGSSVSSPVIDGAYAYHEIQRFSLGVLKSDARMLSVTTTKTVNLGIVQAHRTNLGA